MPKGMKQCPDCKRDVGCKTKTCPGCNHEFVAKSKETATEGRSSDIKKRGRPKGSTNKSKTEVTDKEQVTLDEGDLSTIKPKWKPPTQPRPKVDHALKNKSVVHLRKDDSDWFLELFNKYKKELNSDPIQVWVDYLKNRNPKDFIIGIKPYGFCHFRYLEDGTKEIRELAVFPDWQKKGIARKLLEEVGKPSIVACYKEIEGLYKKCGFIWFGDVVNDKGEKMEVYKWT